MTPRDFCYWLRGFVEINESHLQSNELNGLSDEQWKIIKEHLDKVFDNPRAADLTYNPLIERRLCNKYNPVDGFMHPEKLDSPLSYLPKREGSC